VTTEAPSVETRPINPLAALTLVVVFPGRTFRRLVERPHWILPLVFVSASIVLSSLLLFGAGLMDDAIEIEAFRTGFEPAAIRAGTPAAMVVSGVVGVVVATLLQTLFYVAIARLFGGRGRFRTAFSAVCHASVPVGLVAVLLTALIPFTKSAEFGANLSFLFDAAKRPLLWGVASQIDVAMIWFFVLLGIAAEPVFGLERVRARTATAVFAVVTVLALGWLAGRQAGLAADPYEGWASTQTEACTLHHPRGAPREVLARVRAEFLRSAGRVERLTGLSVGTQAADVSAGARGAQDTADARIDCYVYPSLDEKRRATGDGSPAHRVEWANAVHYALADGGGVFLTRELLKLLDARAHGNVYNPLVRDGLAVYAGGSWGGMNVREAGGDLLHRRVLPGLEALADPVAFADMQETIAQPAAGSFIAFMMSEIGVASLRDAYLSAARNPEEVIDLLEGALGDSIAGIERRWRAYLLGEGSTGSSQSGIR
jgi:hypothetical protein